MQGNPPPTHPKDYSSLKRNVPGRKQWDDIFKIFKEKSEPRILYPGKLFFKNEEEMKTDPESTKAEGVHLHLP